MEIALFGLVSALLGIIFSEILRRRSRIEVYSSRVFDKRLEIYEGLYERVSRAGEVATDVIENAEYSPEQRKQIVSECIHDIAGWCDQNDMYVNEELAVHCVPLLMGVEDLHYITDDPEKRALAEKQFRQNLRLAKKMIRKEAGIEDIERLFYRVTKPKRQSPIIEYYRDLKRRAGVAGKWD